MHLTQTHSLYWAAKHAPSWSMLPHVDINRCVNAHVPHRGAIKTEPGNTLNLLMTVRHMHGDAAMIAMIHKWAASSLPTAGNCIDKRVAYAKQWVKKIKPV